MPTILIVDDEPKIVQLARDYLERAGFGVTSASDGDAALAVYRAQPPDLIVLDLGLPGHDGLDITRAVRRESDVPIIMLTARSEESDKLVGLELGADDYMVKPFSPKELVARVRAVLRRAGGRAGPAAGGLPPARLTPPIPRARPAPPALHPGGVRRRLQVGRVMKNAFPHNWRQRPHRRPPWWPEDEAWPPAGPPGMRRWQRSSRGFLWRMGLMVFLVWIVGTAVCAGTLWLTGVLIGQSGGGFSPATWIPLLLAFILFFALLRGLRLLALPLRDLIDAAQRVEAGDLTPRLRQRGPRELRALARAFNSMLERLLRSERQRRQLLADVTHELRTPVAVLQGNLEGMLDGVYPADAEHLTPLLEETRMLARLIDDLRTLSLAESGVLVLHREPTDLGVLLDEAMAAFRDR